MIALKILFSPTLQAVEWSTNIVDYKPASTVFAVCYQACPVFQFPRPGGGVLVGDAEADVDGLCSRRAMWTAWSLHFLTHAHLLQA